jgi:hypothetical protein
MSRIVLAATIEAISTRQDNSFKIVIGTQEIDKSQVSDLFDMRNKYCKILISDSNITSIEEQLVDAEKVAGGKKAKTPGQRLRNILFRIHKQNRIPQDFEIWYKSEMERIIQTYKDSLNDESLSR